MWRPSRGVGLKPGFCAATNDCQLASQIIYKMFSLTLQPKTDSLLKYDKDETLQHCVTGPGALLETRLPQPPPEPEVVNLDVTTMCALVSEVCNGDTERPHIMAWASKVTHWQVLHICVAILRGVCCSITPNDGADLRIP